MVHNNFSKNQVKVVHNNLSKKRIKVVHKKRRGKDDRKRKLWYNVDD